MQKYIELLKTLISTPSFSKEEEKAAEVMRRFLTGEEIPFKTKENNTWAFNKFFSKEKPTLLLNSHIDTVRPAKGYTLDPFSPIEEGDKLYGLGSNDAGGPLMALLAVFIHFYERDALAFNLVFASTAEEEISGRRGWKLFCPKLRRLNLPLWANHKNGTGHCRKRLAGTRLLCLRKIGARRP
jgi:acetylornithine deacetylase